MKGFRTLVAILVLAGLTVGLGMPVLFIALGIEAFMTPWGFDGIWFFGLFVMVVDFVLAWTFWRRASALDRRLMGLPPTS